MYITVLIGILKIIFVPIIFSAVTAIIITVAEEGIKAIRKKLTYRRECK